SYSLPTIPLLSKSSGPSFASAQTARPRAGRSARRPHPPSTSRIACLRPCARSTGRTASKRSPRRTSGYEVRCRILWRGCCRFYRWRNSRRFATNVKPQGEKPMTYYFTVVHQVAPSTSRPWRLLETVHTSDGPRTRVADGSWKTLEEAIKERDKK